MEIARSKHRLEQFSDGVFSIAITLLALDLNVPQLLNRDIPGGLVELLPLLPNVVTFVISFTAIAIFWVNHHQLTQHIIRIQRNVLWMNMAFLMCITLIPFATNVASRNSSHPLAIITFALILFFSSISFSILRYFVHYGLSEKNIKLGKSLVGPAIYLLAILIAPFFITTSYFLLVIPPIFYFLPTAR